MTRRTMASLVSLLFAGAAWAGEAPRQATFHVKNTFTVKVPKGTQRVRVWFAVPQEDSASVIRNLSVTADGSVQYEVDSWGNRVGYLDLRAPTAEKIAVREEFDLVRSEIRNQIDPKATRALFDWERVALSRYLQPTTHVVITDRIKALSTSIVGGETNPVLASRKIYDWPLQNVDYWVKDPDRLKASPVGSTEYCLLSKTGNCTDFHSLFASLAMAVADADRLRVAAQAHLERRAGGRQLSLLDPILRSQIGLAAARRFAGEHLRQAFSPHRQEQEVGGVDDRHRLPGPDASKVDYYFGNLDERRVVWSVGRDLVMQPPQEDGPVNALTKAYVEVDGKQNSDWTRELVYREVVQ